MKIAIDCRALRKKPAGVPNFLINAINTLASQCPDCTLYLLSNEGFHPEAASRLSKRPNVVAVIEPLPVGRRIATLWYFSKVYFILKRLKPDIFMAPAVLLPPVLPAGIRSLAVVHDMVYKQFPETMSASNRLLSRLLHDYSIRTAEVLWAVSEYTRAEVTKAFPERKCRDIFVGSAIDKAVFRPLALTDAEKQELLRRLSLDQPFILFVGTLEPRKNLHFLLGLMPEMARHGFSLLIVGAKGWGDTRISAIARAPGFPRDKVVFSGYLTTEELVKVYNLASVYVSTALNEGFGLPQLEAMSCGCPVVTAHNSAMIEVVEGAGKTVTGWEQTEWVQSILEVYANRVQYAARGLQRARQYDWPELAGRLLARLQVS
jgi:glycosyltransferase involved in cell wall biosynthesis